MKMRAVISQTLSEMGTGTESVVVAADAKFGFQHEGPSLRVYFNFLKS